MPAPVTCTPYLALGLHASGHGDVAEADVRGQFCGLPGPCLRTAAALGQGAGRGPRTLGWRPEEPHSSHKDSSHSGDLSPDRNVNSCAQNCVPHG